MESIIKINEKTGNRIYSLGDGHVPQVKETDYSNSWEYDYSYTITYEVMVYPHGDMSQMYKSSFHENNGELCWIHSKGVPYNMDDEWEYEGEDLGFIDWGKEELEEKLEKYLKKK